MSKPNYDGEPSKGFVAKWWFFGVLLMVVTGIIIAILNAAGLIFHTAVEREVFKRSYQYQAGKEQQQRILRAQLAEIESQLLDPKLDSGTRRQLKAQQAAIRVRLMAIPQQ